jgi:hypothetical protein
MAKKEQEFAKALVLASLGYYFHIQSKEKGMSGLKISTPKVVNLILPQLMLNPKYHPMINDALTDLVEAAKTRFKIK